MTEVSYINAITKFVCLTNRDETENFVKICETFSEDQEGSEEFVEGIVLLLIVIQALKYQKFGFYSVFLFLKPENRYDINVEIRSVEYTYV